ncbi:2-methoxy-6-polyprenyl-1 4-benzoquinol methylase mitochondrial [Phtheirospermum japonicum]|uniref:2-methoxy-6-polyprenyl-1 4-benzoquinol methylase mitochondrial n=1 Tax=Phtheirospermum japonicum TaxID=374723 RepID=A0A830CX94_9LAMI|nr:2-methoxy-6-polyprenyl-1 4-benzoquinol methylase mitochondrial [Phtheirospermum japonicum]
MSSFGLFKYFRLVSKLNPFPGMKHLDEWYKILNSIKSVGRRAMRDIHDDNVLDETQIFVCDINPNMLNVGKKKSQERGFGNDKSLVWVEGDAEALKFEDNSMDGYTIAFGIRNEKFASMIAESGFEKVEYENLVGGVFAIHSGLKF